MEDWEIRLLDEELDLRKKLIKLTRYIDNEHKMFPENREQPTALMKQRMEQRDVMGAYLKILRERIKDTFPL